MSERSEIWSQRSAGIADVAERLDSFGASLVAADFGRGSTLDLAIGVPGESVRGKPYAGGVNVVFGGPLGLSPANNEFWTQRTLGVQSRRWRFSEFGFSLAAADFSGTSEDELVIGGPGQGIGGAVYVMQSSSSGLSAAHLQKWTQSSQSVKGIADRHDRFGLSLSAGQFGNGDAPDLAVGTPFDDTRKVDDAGSVTVLFGRHDGLSSNRDQRWTQRKIAPSSTTAKLFGLALAAGSYGKGLWTDLAIGAPGDRFSAPEASGAVFILVGSRADLESDEAQVLRQGKQGVRGHSDAGHEFGSTLN